MVEFCCFWLIPNLLAFDIGNEINRILYVSIKFFSSFLYIDFFQKLNLNQYFLISKFLYTKNSFFRISQMNKVTTLPLATKMEKFRVNKRIRSEFVNRK